MANGNRTIATGAVPGPNINAQAGAQFGQGAGAGFGALVGQNIAQRRQAEQLNPLREIFLQSAIADSSIPEAQWTPQQQMIARMAEDPQQFAQLVGGDPAAAVDLAGQFQPEQQEPVKQRVNVSGDSERARLLNQQFGLGIPKGSQAIVELSRAPTGQLISANVVTEPGAAPGSGGGDGSGAFGGSLQGRTLDIFSDLAPRFAEGRTTPEQDRRFVTALTNYLQPEQYQDPDTGLMVTRRNELPSYVRRAAEARGFQIDAESGAIQPPQDFTLRPQQDPQDQAVAQAAAQQMPTVPEESAIPPQDPGTPTLYEQFESGDVTGPVPTVRRGIFRLTGDMFVDAAQETEAHTFVSSLKERLIDALRRNPRYAEGEAQRLFKAVDVQPGAFRSPESAKASAIGFADVLRQIENEMQETIRRGNFVSGETRQHAMDTLQVARNTLDIVAPPRVDPDNLQQYVQTAPPGQKVLVDRGPGDRQVVRVFQRLEDAQTAAQEAQPGEWFYVNGQFIPIVEGQ